MVDAFPIGYITRRDPPSGAAPGWAWTAAILPQLEQSPVYQAMNVDLPIDLPENATVRTWALAIFVCPSDRNTDPFAVTSALTPGATDVHRISDRVGGVPGATTRTSPFAAGRLIGICRPDPALDPVGGRVRASGVPVRNRAD